MEGLNVAGLMNELRRPDFNPADLDLIRAPARAQLRPALLR